MSAESPDEENIIGRVAALDICKAELVCCMRVPTTEGRTGGCRRSGHIPRCRGRVPSWRIIWVDLERAVMEATSTSGSRCSTCWRRTG